ncbi:hypothetical protein OYT1_ch1609 [Ferriphaselus amnicola]|uniref:Uncharacterized protein n=1 Tax=Ferriphaselus amnicola TaxID=1188319 RepID=A0A2Z6GCC9_9PROT|nr:hypothetical protein [Ferriphaselus amnicola]BBE51156.1 hypothetical protein OYT1_ch1609 [Ferriphaselus amnicola]
MKFITVLLVAVGQFITLSSAVASPSMDKLIEKFDDPDIEFQYLMSPKNYGAAPYVCEGARFAILSLGDDAGGRIFFCKKMADRNRLANYYRELGKSSALFFSWVFVKGNVVLQLNGDLSEQRAKDLASSIPDARDIESK